MIAAYIIDWSQPLNPLISETAGAKVNSLSSTRSPGMVIISASNSHDSSLQVVLVHVECVAVEV